MCSINGLESLTVYISVNTFESVQLFQASTENGSPAMYTLTGFSQYVMLLI